VIRPSELETEFGIRPIDVAYRADAVVKAHGKPERTLELAEVAFREVRNEPCGGGMSLIALSGWGQEDDRRRTVASGFDAHLVKPVDPVDLMDLLGIYSQARRRQLQAQCTWPDPPFHRPGS
jgi:hypothetical protein